LSKLCHSLPKPSLSNPPSKSPLRMTLPGSQVVAILSIVTSASTGVAVSETEVAASAARDVAVGIAFVAVGTAFVLVGIVVLVLGTKTAVAVDVVVIARAPKILVAAVVAGMGVSVGKTRITGVLVGTGVSMSMASLVGSEVGCGVGVVVFPAVCASLGEGRGRSQELAEMTTTNATKSKHDFLQTGLSIMGKPPLPIAV
jgi:hypothetical protein